MISFLLLLCPAKLNQFGDFCRQWMMFFQSCYHMMCCVRYRTTLKKSMMVVDTGTRSGIRADSRWAPNQWETSLQSNTVSHWIGTNLEPGGQPWAGWIQIDSLARLHKFYIFPISLYMIYLWGNDSFTCPGHLGKGNCQAMDNQGNHKRHATSSPHKHAMGCLSWPMMTSSNGNIFRIIGHLCGEFTSPRWIPRTKASDAFFLCFLWSTPE